MTHAEISTMIASVGLPYAYDHFTKAESPGGPPFICFLCQNSDNFAADGVVYQPISALTIELYTAEKSFEYEAAVEAALTAAGLFFDKDETWLDSERMFEVVYTTEVAITTPEPVTPTPTPPPAEEPTQETEEEQNVQE